MSPSSRSRSTQAVACELALEVLRQSGRLVLPAIGRSMVPTIWPGDTLVVEPANSQGVTAGDIVLFSNAFRFVVHRVVEKNTDSDCNRVVTRGDAMATADAAIRPSDVLGKVSFIMRDGKCFAAKKGLRRSERALAALLRRSDTAARVVLGVHGLSQRSFKAV